MGVQYWIRSNAPEKLRRRLAEFNPRLQGATLIVEVSTDLILDVDAAIAENEDLIEGWDWNYA